ncbi:MAG: peptide chain release factor N(5)-glutamine methyltransferase [Candidatus Komeilibacteria bacterium]
MPLTITKALRYANKNLTSPKYGLDAELILSKIIKKPRSYVLTHTENQLNFLQSCFFYYLLKQRAKGKPLAYLLGRQEFYGRDFLVNKHTLIPRPESELFIDELKKINPKKTNIIDIGTGSGCLIISAAQELPDNNFFATDISTQTLKIAKQNAGLHKVNINFISSDLLAKINHKIISQAIIIANLPYLTAEQLDEPTIKYEPRQALYGGAAGLMLYHQLLVQIKALATLPQYLFIEIDPRQNKQLCTTVTKLFPGITIDIIKDLVGQPRLLKIKFDKP